jgi:hypothetical protein
MTNLFKKAGIVCLLLFLTHNLFAQCNREYSLCGIKSILVIYKHFGITPELRETGRLIRKYPDGMSMYQLSRILEREGLYTKGVKISTEELKGIDIPAIGYFYPNHFAVMEGYKDGKFKVVDLPDIFYCTDEKLASNYSGFALLVSSDKDFEPHIERDAPDIRFKSHEYRFRRAEHGKKLSFTFKMENRGNQPLVIKRVRSGCGSCIASEEITISNKFLLPGESGRIVGIFDTTGRTDWQSEVVYVTTNDPVTPITPLYVRGFVNGGIAESVRYNPSEINFGVSRKGQTVARQLYLFPGRKNLKITKIDAPNFCNVTVTKHSNPSRFQLYIIFSPEEINPNFEDTLKIYIKPKQHFLLSLLRRSSKTEIPIRAEVKGHLVSFPEFFFFGIMKTSQEISRTISLSDYLQRDFRIENITRNVDWVSVAKEETKTNPRKYQLTAQLNPERLKEGISKGEIFVETSLSEHPLTIPVYVWLK